MSSSTFPISVLCIRPSELGHGNVGYSVEPHADGATLTLEIDYEIPIPVLGKLAEHIAIQRNSREFESDLVNVKETLEG